jgi:hypothetical protein
MITHDNDKLCVGSRRWGVSEKSVALEVNVGVPPRRREGAAPEYCGAAGKSAVF